MASSPKDAFALRTVGDWIRKTEVPLKDALYVSVKILGRTGLEACKHAVILMATGARARTPTAPRNRPVVRNARFKHLLSAQQYKAMKRAGKSAEEMAPYYQYVAFRPAFGTGRKETQLYANNPKQIRRIRNSGLARRSWMWDLSLLANSRRPVPGTSEVLEEKSDRIVSYTKRNKLDYIEKIMPAGFEAAVQRSAVNRIMAVAAKKMQSQFARAIERGGRSIEGGDKLSSFFLGAAA